MNNITALESYFEKTKIPVRLACMSDMGWPVVLSLWYLFEEGFLYCATPQNARVVSYLLTEPRCGFEIAADQPPYCGVRGQALATIDPNRGQEILGRLLSRYLGSVDNPLAKKLLARPQLEVAIRLDPQNSSTWNFTMRMVDSISQQNEKACPGS